MIHSLVFYRGISRTTVCEHTKKYYITFIQKRQIEFWNILTYI